MEIIPHKMKPVSAKVNQPSRSRGRFSFAITGGRR